jgi:hypothetical protein
MAGQVELRAAIIDRLSEVMDPESGIDNQSASMLITGGPFLIAGSLFLASWWIQPKSLKQGYTNGKLISQ